MAAITVSVAARIPLSTKVRMKVGLLLARLGLESLTLRVIGRLAYDVKIGSRPWTRHYAHLERN